MATEHTDIKTGSVYRLSDFYLPNPEACIYCVRMIDHWDTDINLNICNDFRENQNGEWFRLKDQSEFLVLETRKDSLWDYGIFRVFVLNQEYPTVGWLEVKSIYDYNFWKKIESTTND